MKKVFLILVVLLGASTILAQESVIANEKDDVNWEVSFNDALQKAKDENKPVLVYFTGSDWCPPCKKIDRELFHTEKFKGFSEKNLILYKADFPRNKDLVAVSNQKMNVELKFKYGISSFPSMIMVNANGSVLGEKRGAYMTEYYYPFLESIVNNY